MFNDALDGVALHILDDGQLGLAAEGDREQRVRVAQGQRGLLHRELHERRLVAARVQGGGDKLGHAHAARSALAEFVTDVTGDLDGVCHNGSP